MGQRSARVNELIMREINHVLRQDFQDDSVYITVVEVDVSPDLRNARVHYSVIGESSNERKAAQFFKRYGILIRRKVMKKVILKYTPEFRFMIDHSSQRAVDLLQKMDDLGLEDEDH